MDKKGIKSEYPTLKHKIALGTVQFGLKYGINNKYGVIDDNSLTELLNYAFEKGVDFLDTAYNYGESEKRLGKYLSNYDYDFKVISKAPKGTNSRIIKKNFAESLENLTSKSLYGYLLHDFNDYLNDKKIILDLIELKERGLVSKIGFSLYYPEQLEIIIKDQIKFDLIQIPYNLADRRFEKYFEELKNTNVEIHIRSVFLQGLFFMKPDELSQKLKPFVNLLKTLEFLSGKFNRSIENIALNFVYQNNNIDKVVIGVDTIDQLKSNLNESNNKIAPELLLDIKAKLSSIEFPKELLIPSNWN